MSTVKIKKKDYGKKKLRLKKMTVYVASLTENHISSLDWKSRLHTFGIMYIQIRTLPCQYTNSIQISQCFNIKRFVSISQ